jgi:hypothetical protein
MLLLKARAGRRARLHADRAIIRPSFSQSTVAPAMGSVLDVGYVLGKGFVGQGRDVHFLGPNVAANVVWFHESDAWLCDELH